jgi:Polyketide cyclase / dehydrase and lipid transport
MPSLEPVDETYFERAPQRFVRTWSIAQPAEKVWAELTSEQPLHWVRGLHLRWTSPRPFGVGTTRQGKTMGGAMTVDEHFFIWEEGKRYAFYVTQINVPIVKSFAEDYLLEPDSANGCRFTWRIAITPSALGRPGAPLNKLMANRTFRDTGRYFNA